MAVTVVLILIKSLIICALFVYLDYSWSKRMEDFKQDYNKKNYYIITEIESVRAEIDNLKAKEEEKHV